MGINPFAQTGGFRESLEHSTDINVNADEITFSVGSGKSSAKYEGRIGSFLSLVDFLSTFDPATAEAGSGVTATVEISYKNVPVDPEDPQGETIRTPDLVSFKNPRTNRRVNLPYDAARDLLQPSILDEYEARIERDDVTEAFANSFTRVQTEATPTTAAINRYDFRLSFAPNTRTMRVPVKNWGDFVGYLTRIATWVTENVPKYQTSEDEDAEVSQENGDTN